jgi:phosphoribosylpyrophosphate synthetase
VLLSYLEKKHPEVLKDMIVISSDTGGTSRVKAFANKLGIKSIAIGYKHIGQKKVKSMSSE